MEVELEEVESGSLGPEVLESEIEESIKQMKDRKAVDIDDIPGEMLKRLSGTARSELICFCKEMYEKGQWPEDFTKVIIVTLPKKMNTMECKEHRTWSLTTHASKIMLKVLTREVESKANHFIGKTQFGFRRGCGTRDAIATLRILYKRCLKHDETVFVCFVDYEKAFDRVNWTKLMEI